MPVSPTVFSREFATIALHDRRREQRLLRIVEQCRAAPDSSFPDIAETAADLTALYRFIGSSAVTPGAILEPHSQETAKRCAETRKVLVVHDTTECEFSGDSRRNLGPLRGKDQGFLAHVALAVAGDGSRRPLGILGVDTWRRIGLGKARRPDGARKAGGDYHKEPDKESVRWWNLIDQTEDRLGGVEAIHVGDRETDAFHLLRDALDHEVRFVFRMARDRVLLDQDDERLGRVSEVLAQCDDVLEMEVELSRRAAKPTPRSTESAREARIAKLAVRGIKTRIARPNYDRDSASLEVNLVYVREVDPPADVEPVAWVLTTTEPIGTPQQLREVIEIYRTRWLIEELFKALKTGCAFEKRQLESYETLTNAWASSCPSRGICSFCATKHARSPTSRPSASCRPCRSTSFGPAIPNSCLSAPPPPMLFEPSPIWAVTSASARQAGSFTGADSKNSSTRGRLATRPRIGPHL